MNGSICRNEFYLNTCYLRGIVRFICTAIFPISVKGERISIPRCSVCLTITVFSTENLGGTGTFTLISKVHAFYTQYN